MNLGDKVALVTGGAIGLGFAYAKELLRNGVKHVAIADLESSSGEESAKKLNAEFGKGRAIFIVCDVTKASEFEAAFVKTIKDLGGLDIVINNAGIANETRWELMIDVNLKGPVCGTQLGLQYMGKHKGGEGGVIVNIASILGIDPIAWSPVYVATKHAIVGLSKSFGMPYYFDKTGVRMITLCPGVTKTQMLSNHTVGLTDLIDFESLAADMANYESQEPEIVAQGMMHLIRSAKSGSVWVAEGGKPVHEIFFPDRFTLEANSAKRNILSRMSAKTIQS